MGRRPGETVKTTKWAFLVSPENAKTVFDALQRCHIRAAISPLHDRDAWDRPGILNYLESWSKRRYGLLFFYDESFDPGDGFSFDDVILRSDLPLYAAWPAQADFPKDAEGYDYDDDFQRFYVELPTVGEQKKPHYHMQVDLIGAKTRDQLLASLKVPESCMYYWEPVGNPAGLLRYYAHMDNPEKVQYDKEDVISIGGFDKSALYRKTEAEKVSEFEYIYAVVSSCPPGGLNLLTVSDALITAKHPELAYKLKSSSGYWKEIIYQLNRKYQREVLGEKFVTTSKKDLMQSEGAEVDPEAMTKWQESVEQIRADLVSSGYDAFVNAS